MLLLASYPTASVIIVATLNISIREYYPECGGNVEQSHWHPSYPEKVRWRMHTTIFGLDSDPIISIKDPLSDPVHKPLFDFHDIGSSEFEACFFRDASRSGHYTVDDQQHIAVATKCLSFVTRRTFPMYPPTLVRVSKLKTHPWFTRRRKRATRRGIPHMNVTLPTCFRPDETPAPDVQILLSLRIALRYLPPLLHSSTYSDDLVEFAKCWSSRGYLYHLFPVQSRAAGIALKGYLLRIGSTDR